jgi:hypothetical protein
LTNASLLTGALTFERDFYREMSLLFLSKYSSEVDMMGWIRCKLMTGLS